jgi:prepilin-type processing-associated H-X9-DG protein
VAGGMNMHRQGNNVLFADNHVATFRKWQASELTYSPKTMATWEDVGPE